jgi:DNA-binding transcriptional MerR regulator
MTVGELARRTGLSIRAIRVYEGLGLIYSAGRSEGNYRLFDETALWCAGAVEKLRSLGLTLAELRSPVRAVRITPLTVPRIGLDSHPGVRA